MSPVTDWLQVGEGPDGSPSLPDAAVSVAEAVCHVFQVDIGAAGKTPSASRSQDRGTVVGAFQRLLLKQEPFVYHTVGMEQAIEELQAAMAALNEISKNAIMELRDKCRNKPSPAVKALMEQMSIMFEQSTPRPIGVEDIERAQYYEKDNIPGRVIKAIHRYVSDKDFRPEKVAGLGQAAPAYKAFWLWVRAMHSYALLTPKFQADNPPRLLTFNPYLARIPADKLTRVQEIAR